MPDGAFLRDANRVPITDPGIIVSKVATFTGNGTVALPIFHITETVEVLSLWGVVTTAIGSNCTATHWRINDQTITTQVISLATGTTLSSLAIGSIVSRFSLVSVALKASTSATGLVTDPVAATPPAFFMPFLITQKAGGIETNVEFVYTTNNSSAGVITFYIGYVPLTPLATITAY